MIEPEPEGETLCQHGCEAFTAYRDGDRVALDELVTLLTPLMWHTVRAQGLDAVAAEDVVQTVWMRLLHGADAIRDNRTIVKWLLTSSRREAWRVSKRARADVVRTAAVLEQVGQQLDRIPVQRDQLPEEVVVRGERQRALWEHVRVLPERCRELMRVIAFADRPDYAQIADALGMPIGSIGPTRGRCLAKLRHQLANDPQWEGTLP